MSIPFNQKGYCNSQLDDYHSLPRREFKWSPPVELALHARASHHAPRGTLGFGFWNDPFTLSLGQGGAARRLPAPPQAIWFFYGSDESDLPLAPGVRGWGWKAATLRSPTIPPLLLAPAAATALALSSLPLLRSWVIKSAIKVVDAAESLLPVSLRDWHRYAIDWTDEGVTFKVDQTIVLQTELHPPGPLGFVLWIDNQFAIANPKIGFRFGTTPIDVEQWLQVRMERLSSA